MHCGRYCFCCCRGIALKAAIREEGVVARDACTLRGHSADGACHPAQMLRECCAGAARVLRGRCTGDRPATRLPYPMRRAAPDRPDWPAPSVLVYGDLHCGSISGGLFAVTKIDCTSL